MKSLKTNEEVQKYHNVNYTFHTGNSSATTYTYDLSKYLPNKETRCYFRCMAWNRNSTFTHFFLWTSLQGEIDVGSCGVDGADSTNTHVGFVGKDRIVKLRFNAPTNGGTDFKLIGYEEL